MAINIIFRENIFKNPLSLSANKISVYLSFSLSLSSMLLHSWVTLHRFHQHPALLTTQPDYPLHPPTVPPSSPWSGEVVSMELINKSNKDLYNSFSYSYMLQSERGTRTYWTFQTFNTRKKWSISYLCNSIFQKKCTHFTYTCTANFNCT